MALTSVFPLGSWLCKVFFGKFAATAVLCSHPLGVLFIGAVALGVLHVIQF